MMSDIRNGAFLLNAISHSEKRTMFYMYVSRRMESNLNCYKTRAVFVFNNSYFKLFLSYY
jgi:hypothetical protein